MHKVRDTLAGRASYTTLWPLTRRERLGFGQAGRWDALRATPTGQWPELLASDTAPAEPWRDIVRRGGYPVPALQLGGPDAWAEWFQGYINTYLDRDVPELVQIASPLDLHRLMRQVCLNIGQPEHQARWGTDIGLKRATVSRYLDLLEVSYQLVRVPAYSVNHTKRLTRTPKVYWSDVALGMHLAGLAEPTGAHFENLVLEVKAAAKPSYSDARHLRSFLAEYGAQAVGALLLHDGNEIFWISESVLAAPWWRVL